MKKSTHLPRARTEGLVVEELTDEVLVYDLQRHKAHCLNLTAAAIWKQCDGRSTAAQIADRLNRQEMRQDSEIRGQSSHVRAHEAIVWLALDQLSRDHLLEEQVSWPEAV